MKKKILSVLLIGIVIVSLTGCGNTEEDRKDLSSSIEFDYSKINTDSENIGKNVDVKTILNEDIKPGAYEGVEFTNNNGDLNEFDGKVGNLNWVVLAEDDNNYMLTTVKSTSDSFRLKGADGYNNALQAMNAFCAKYYSVEINGKKYVARNLNLNDIEMYYKDKTDTWKQETLRYSNFNKTGKETTKYQYYPSLFAMEVSSGMGGKLDSSETPNGYEPYNNSYKSDSTSTTEYLDTYYSANSTQLKDNFFNLNAYNVIFEAGSPYWGATRATSFGYSGLSPSTTYAEFGVLRISTTGLSFVTLAQSDQGTDFTLHNMLSVRPVVVVPKSEIDL